MSGPSGRTRNKKQRTDTTAEILRRIQTTRIISKNEIRYIFHLDKPVCHGCRGNTKDSPHCLCGMAPSSTSIRKHGLWQKLSDTIDSLGPDPTKQMRDNGDLQPAGLTNLGATCYVNSVLQCLYMNTEFRDGLFAAEAELVRDQPVLHQLARLFAQLHSGKRLSVDSAEFAITLELDNAIQQDGQEFLKLLLTLLERILSQSRVAESRSIVQNLFRGTFSYVTKCSACGKESDSSNQFVDFYELEVNVKGFSGLEESLDDYLSEDKLQGENQYFCQHCNTRVDATHSTKLRLLPPVLNFQLKRFVFNSKTATKKKVTSKFSFPKVLTMGSRVSPIGATSDPYVYELSAILIHKGSMANSGHYIANIKDERTGQWWHFDDETVTSLGSEALGDKASSSSSCKDELMSADAYMLMYSRKTAADTAGGITEKTMDSSREQRARRSQQFLPEHLRGEVEELNTEFMESCKAYAARKDEQVKYIADRKDEVRKVLASAPVESTASKFFWISTEWLRTWADSLLPPSPIDNNQLLCEHNGVSPKKIPLMKCITEAAWVSLQSKYAGGPELTIDNCCLNCIYEDADASATADTFRSERAAMKGLAENAMSGNGLDGELFYVSKTWLLQWMRRKTADALCGADADPTTAITCPHGGLLPEAAGSKRQEIPQVLWNYFLQNALQVAGDKESGHKPFPVDTEICCICEAEMSEVNNTQEGLRATRLEERQKQEAVYSGKNVALVSNNTYYLVPSTWLAQWRAYVGASGKNVLNHNAPAGLEGYISSLICEKHGRLLYKPPELSRSKRGELFQKSSNDDMFTVVSEEDWQFFCQRWNVESGKGIEAVVDHVDDTLDSNGKEDVQELKQPVLRTKPEVCRQCIDDRESTELIRKLSYTNETIAVELIEGTEPPKSLLFQSQATEADNRRTSKRTRRSGNNKRMSLTVSGCTTVYQLKLLIWECHGVVKENQKVHFGRRELTDESSTLADVGILPGCQLWVIDTGLHENRDIAEELPLIQGDKVESGFRGTRLLDSGVSAFENGDLVDMDLCKNGDSSRNSSDDGFKSDVPEVEMSAEVEVT